MLKLMFLVGIFFVLQARAYIPSSGMIVDRVVENSLKAPLYVEQEVTIGSGAVSITVKEQWLFENENSFRLIVRGEKDLKDQIVFQSLYSDIQKTSSLSGLLQTTKLPRALLEKVLFIKTSDALKKFLVQQGIVTDEIYRSHNFKKGSGNTGFQYLPESFLRLGRLAGGVSYVFGPNSKADVIAPGFWVEQDYFNILKIRNSNGDEMRLVKPTTFSRGAKWPKEITYTSNGSNGAPQIQAQVLVTNVRLAEALQKQIFQKHVDKRALNFDQHSGKSLLEDFYQRFR
jgi:hypothetical protein